MSTVLFFRSRAPSYPNDDVALEHGSAWLELAIQEAAKRGYNVIDLYAEAATFESLKSIIESEKIDVAVMFGHGGPNIFTGYDVQEVLLGCMNDEVMSGTITHFLSCLVGQQLLPSIISKKGIWTVGYQVSFTFMIDPPEAEEPFKDITLAIITKMLDGGTLKEVWDAGIAKGEEWIARLWNRPEAWCAETIQYIDEDIRGMIGLGDQEAYVLPPRLAVITPQSLLFLAALFFILKG